MCEAGIIISFPSSKFGKEQEGMRFTLFYLRKKYQWVNPQGSCGKESPRS